MYLRVLTLDDEGLCAAKSGKDTRRGRREWTRGHRHDETVILEKLRSEWITLNAEEYNRMLQTGEKIFNLLADVESR
jgi:hypothetical protein